jgi:DNA excision repair protein ERCC-2
MFFFYRKHNVDVYKPFRNVYCRSLLNTLEVLTFDEFSPLSLVSDFFTLIGTYWEGFILITDPYPEAEGIYDPVIQLSCLDSSLAMKRIFKHFQSIILTSGTISPLFLYPKLLGFNPVIVKSLPMSLDRNCICPLIIVKGADQVNTLVNLSSSKMSLFLAKALRILVKILDCVF